MSRFTPIAALVVLLSACAHGGAGQRAVDAPADDALLAAAALRADLDQLVGLLESAHPDAYSNGGGRIAFYRRAQAARAAIVDAGMTPRAFLRLVQPVVAAVGDGHTKIRLRPGLPPQRPRPWIDFDAIGERLYVSAVYRPEERPLLGARLEAVAGVPFDELARRMGRIRGYDNVYTNLFHLFSALRTPAEIADLLAVDAAPPVLGFRLRLRGGEVVDRAFLLLEDAPGPALVAPTALALPELDSAGLAWGLLGEGEERRVGYLRVASCSRYREAFEIWRSTGYNHNLGDHLTGVARQAAGGEVPDGVAERIALVPSATETVSALLDAMRVAGSDSLIVDLRGNPGGSSVVEYILAFFLYGREALFAPSPSYQIPRYSALYFDNYEGQTLASVAPGLEVGDLDFSGERAWRSARAGGDTPEARRVRRGELERAFAMVPTFDRAYRATESVAPFAGRVVVVTDAMTYSAGFDVAAMLFEHGAEVVGVPSAQAGNCFIDSLSFTLEHSGLAGTISYKRSLRFPADEALGRVLTPAVELTPEVLARLDYDPNASVRLALERLAGD